MSSPSTIMNEFSHAAIRKQTIGALLIELARTLKIEHIHIHDKTYSTARAIAEDLFDSGRRVPTDDEKDRVYKALLEDYLDEWYTTATPNAREARGECLRTIENMRLRPINKIYKELQNTFYIHDMLDSQELFDIVWDLAEEFHDNGKRPLTAYEKWMIRHARNEALNEHDEFSDHNSP